MVKAELTAVALVTGLAGVVLAAPASGDPGIGMPPSPSCYGQSVGAFAQQFGGIANTAQAFGITIQDGHDILRGGCGRTSGFTPGL